MPLLINLHMYSYSHVHTLRCPIDYHADFPNMDQKMVQEGYGRTSGSMEVISSLACSAC